jgi:hypothetical protein
MPDFDNCYFYGENPDYPAMSVQACFVPSGNETLFGFPVVISEKVPKDEVRFMDGLANRYTLKLDE